MKRTLLLKKIAAQGAVLLRHGRNHDIYVNPGTGRKEAVPRHQDIGERLAKDIIWRLSH